jgi:hypothetical protein
MNCRIPATSIVLLGIAMACGPDEIVTASILPPLIYEGEWIRVGTDFEVPLCAGNIADFDHEIERIDTTLELDAEGKTDMWILGDGSLYQLFCPDAEKTCTPWHLVEGTLVRKRAPDVLWHALAHDRVNRAARSGLGQSNGLFVEGMAEALARTYCEPTIPLDIQLPNTDSLLAAERAHPDFDFLEYTLASHLTRWLLVSFDAQALQEFMVAVDHDDSPDAVRTAYEAHFGSSLDEDLFSHLDWSVDDRHPYEVGCRGEAPPSGASGTVHTLQATLDCSSELVRSNFYEHRPERLNRGYVEWAFEVETAGQYELVGELPAGTEMTIARCDCQALDDGYWPGADPTIARPFSGEWLTAGLYRVVWKGPLDPELTLDVTIVRL